MLVYCFARSTLQPQTAESAFSSEALLIFRGLHDIIIIIITIYFNCKWGSTQLQWYYINTQHTNNTQITHITKITHHAETEPSTQN
jgi:hypothetical protein